MKIQGIFIAAATPFDYKGKIYKVKVQHNIEKWNLTAVSGYAFATPAGEGQLLREEEKVALWAMAAHYAAPEKILVADVSAEGVEVSAHLAKAAAEVGFHAILCGAPHCGAETQMLYFRSVADRSPIPVIVESAPAETASALAAHPNIVGLIASGDSRIRGNIESGLNVLTGSSSSLWESLERGASGALLSLASAVPYACITLWEAFRTREREAGMDWQAKITRASSVITEAYGAPGLKYAMELNGYYGGPPRLPYCPPDQNARREIEAAFRDLRG